MFSNKLKPTPILHNNFLVKPNSLSLITHQELKMYSTTPTKPYRMMLVPRTNAWPASTPIFPREVKPTQYFINMSYSSHHTLLCSQDTIYQSDQAENWQEVNFSNSQNSSLTSQEPDSCQCPTYCAQPANHQNARFQPKISMKKAINSNLKIPSCTL